MSRPPACGAAERSAEPVQHRPGKGVHTLALLAWVASSCGGGEPFALVPLPHPDQTEFAQVVGPILEERCADGTCHGSAERPFSLYARGRRRSVDIATFSREPLTPAEVGANYSNTLGLLDSTEPVATTLLHKALSLGGPTAHGGGAVFSSAHDPQCVALVRWIVGGVGP
jgi:hypothetical protein